MRHVPLNEPAYFHADGQIMERGLNGPHPITKARARILSVRLRDRGVALEATCPEAAAFVRTLFIDLFNSLTGLRAAEREPQDRRAA